MKENSRTRSMVGPKSSRSLHGKSIYLDLFGYRNVAEFEKNLQLLGAVIEKCFSKEVSHVITNRATTINSQTRSASKNQTAETAIASPLSLSPFADSGGSQSPFAFSPILTDSASRPMTRGQAIVQKAMLSRKSGSTNVIDCALQWNIKVIHINAAVKWVKKELGAMEALKQEKKSKVMQLARPYIKFEENHRRFYPEFKSFARFPSLEFNGPCTTCPFDQFAKPCSAENAGNQAERSPCQKASAELASEAEYCQVKPNTELPAELKRKKPDKEKRKFTGVTVLSSKYGKLMTAGELQKLKNSRINAARQIGFCEICDIKYDNVLQHLRTKKHKSFVEDVGNYQSLDKLIKQIPDETIFQMNDPMNEFPMVLTPPPTGSSEAGEYDLNLLSVPSSSLSSHFKAKVLPEWNNSCSTFCLSARSNGEVQVASNMVLQNTPNLLPKHLATADDTKPNELKMTKRAVEETHHKPLGKHSKFNEQKSSYVITNYVSFDKNAVNSERNVDRFVNLGDHGCENLTTSKVNNSLRPDNIIPQILVSDARCKLNIDSVSSSISFMHQSDECELDSDEVSSEIPVIQSMHHSKETSKMDSEGIHVSSKPPIALPVTFAHKGFSLNCDAASEFPVLQPPCHTDQLRLQSKISCPATVTGSPHECYEHCYSPSKFRKHCVLNMTGSPLKLQRLPLPEVMHFHQASLGSLEKCFLDGCKSRKRKRIKFSHAVSVLTNRSVLELFKSDTSSDFEGFTEVPEQVVSDLSLDEVSEAVLSIDSDFDWASTSSDSRLDSQLADTETITPAFSENPVSSFAPIVTSVSKDCILSDADLKIVCDEKAQITHSISNKNVLTIVDLSNHESDNDDYLSSLNYTGVFNCFGEDTPASLLVKPVSLNGKCCPGSLMKDKSDLNQLSVDNGDCFVTAVNGKINQVPANVMLPLTLTNAKNTASRPWQPAVALTKCGDWKRGCDGDKEEQMSASDLHSAVQKELSSEAYSLVEAANGSRKLRRKLNFSCVNSESQSCGLKEKRILRSTEKCSGILNCLPSENMSTSYKSNTEALCCKVEMPKVMNVLDLVDLESDGDIRVKEILATALPSDEQIMCSEIYTVNILDQNSVGSHNEHVQEMFSRSSPAFGVITAIKSDKTVDVINVGENPIQTDDLTKMSSEVSNAIVSCNLKAGELMITDQDFSEMAAECNILDRTHLKLCYDKIRTDKIWQPVVVLDKSSVKSNIPCLHQPNVSTSTCSRSDDEHVAKMPFMENGMISIEPLSGFHSAFVLADAQRREMPFAKNENILSGRKEISRSLVVLLNRCDSQLADLCGGVLTQKSAAELPEKRNLLDIKSHCGCTVNAISLINSTKDMNIAVDLQGNDNTCQVCEHKLKDASTLGCERGATSEKLTVRICRSKTFENYKHVHSSIGVNTTKNKTNADVNLRSTSVTGAVSDYVSPDNSYTNRKSIEISTGQKVSNNIYSQVNRSLSRKYMDWSKPQTCETSIDSKRRRTIKTNPRICQDLSKINAGSCFPHRNNDLNHFFLRSKADWSKASPPAG